MVTVYLPDWILLAFDGMHYYGPAWYVLEEQISAYNILFVPEALKSR